MIGRKIVWLKTHATVFVQGLGNLKDTFTTGASGQTSDLVMTKGEGVVNCSSKGIDFFVPDSNIIAGAYAKEEPKKAK